MGSLVYREYFLFHSKLNTILEIRDGSKTAATSKVDLFVVIVNGWKPLTTITKNSTLDVAVVLDPPLEIVRIFVPI